MSYFFLFKQKTAYEMRISDWSSDVCSSDLRRRPGAGDLAGDDPGGRVSGYGVVPPARPCAPQPRPYRARTADMGDHGPRHQSGRADPPPVRRGGPVPHHRPGAGPRRAADPRQAARPAQRFQHTPNRDDADERGHHPEGIAWKVRQTTLSENISTSA